MDNRQPEPGRQGGPPTMPAWAAALVVTGRPLSPPPLQPLAPQPPAPPPPLQPPAPQPPAPQPSPAPPRSTLANLAAAAAAAADDSGGGSEEPRRTGKRSRKPPPPGPYVRGADVANIRIGHARPSMAGRPAAAASAAAAAAALPCSASRRPLQDAAARKRIRQAARQGGTRNMRRKLADGFQAGRGVTWSRFIQREKGVAQAGNEAAGTGSEERDSDCKTSEVEGFAAKMVASAAEGAGRGGAAASAASAPAATARAAPAPAAAAASVAAPAPLAAPQPPAPVPAPADPFFSPLVRILDNKGAPIPCRGGRGHLGAEAAPSGSDEDGTVVDPDQEFGDFLHLAFADRMRRYRTSKDNETVRSVANQFGLSPDVVLRLNHQRQQHVRGWCWGEPSSPQERRLLVNLATKFKTGTWLFLPPDTTVQAAPKVHRCKVYNSDGWSHVGGTSQFLMQARDCDESEVTHTFSVTHDAGALKQLLSAQNYIVEQTANVAETEHLGKLVLAFGLDDVPLYAATVLAYDPVERWWKVQHHGDDKSLEDMDMDQLEAGLVAAADAKSAAAAQSCSLED
eukprot:SAG22_NODE_3174_length_1879_cov_1.760674_1_plen_568_part_10